MDGHDLDELPLTLHLGLFLHELALARLDQALHLGLVLLLRMRELVVHKLWQLVELVRGVLDGLYHAVVAIDAGGDGGHGSDGAPGGSGGTVQVRSSSRTRLLR